MTHPDYLTSDSGIYYALNKINHRIYVGKATCIRLRTGIHFDQLTRGKHPNPRLQADWNAHGASAFEWGVLVTEPRDQNVRRPLRLTEIEVIFIHAYQAADPQFGYNRTRNRSQEHQP